jgi:hypothetical protein
MNDMEKKVRLLIDSLPKDEAGLVKYLGDLGIKGEPSVPAMCPLAKYFRSRGVPDARVSRSEVMLGHFEVVRMPDLLRDFVNNFDHGRYPELRA